MEIKNMNMEEVETRSAELGEMLNAENADLESIENEVTELEERKAEILKETEERSKQVAEVIATKPVIETFEKEETRTMMDIKELRNTPEYINAYAEYIKGDDKEIRALLSENATNGTVAVPELVYDIVKNAWEREGIMSRVRKTYLKGNLKVQFEISATGATAHTESANSAVSEEDLVLGIVQLVPVSIKKWISISDEALDLAGENFLRYIYDELTYQIAKKASDLLITKIEACGTVSTTTCPSVPILTDASLGVDTVAQAMALLSDQASNPVVIMNRQTWGAFKTAQAGAGYNYDPFEGLPVLFNNTITAYSVASSGDTYAIVGDLGEGALANFPNGDEINIKFDDLSKAEYDLVRIIGREFVGLGVVAPDHFVKVQK